MFRLEFLIGESTLPRDMTVYQAVQQFGAPVNNYENTIINVLLFLRVKLKKIVRKIEICFITRLN